MAPGELGTCGSMLVSAGGTIPGALDRLERLEEGGIAMDEGALGTLVTKADGMSSGPPVGTAGVAASRVEAGAEMLSGATTLGARADWDMEAGAETDETGGEVADKAGLCVVAIPAKDSIQWDPSLSAAAKTNTC